MQLFWLVYMWHKSMHPGAPHSMYVRFWSLHSCTRCFKVFWSSCWPSTSYFVGHVSREYIKWDWVHWTQLLGCCTTVVLCICIEVELTISAKCPYLLALDVFVAIGVDTIQITSSAYFSVCWWCGCTVLLFCSFQTYSITLLVLVLPYKRTKVAKHFNMI